MIGTLGSGASDFDKQRSFYNYARRMRKWIVIAVLSLATARFAHIAYQGLTYSIGDFYSTLPGAYVEAFNPTLWASPDLTNMIGRASHYHRGPSQYLTTLPLSYLDSYREIALVLLVVYAVLIPGIAYVMWRMFAPGPRDYQLLAMVMSSSLLFFPTLQAYIAREFELVILAGTVLMFSAAASGRLATAGAWAAYITLYKYLPVALLPYFVVRRWWRALAGFAAASLVIMAAAHLLFGLGNFASDGYAGSFVTALWANLQSTQEFCYGEFQFLRYSASTNDVSVGLGLCGVQERVPLPVVTIYLGLIGATLLTLGYGFFRLELGGARDAAVERWRRILELSAVVIVYTTFFLTHYYYLTILIVPLTALMVRAYLARRRGLWVAWAVSYLLLSAFLVPLTAVGRLVQADLWTLYVHSLAYLPGELLLLGTVLYEYVGLGTRDTRAPSPSSV